MLKEPENNNFFRHLFSTDFLNLRSSETKSKLLVFTGLWLQHRSRGPGIVSWAMAQQLSMFLYFFCPFYGIQGTQVILAHERDWIFHLHYYYGYEHHPIHKYTFPVFTLGHAPQKLWHRTSHAKYKLWVILNTWIVAEKTLTPQDNLFAYKFSISSRCSL